MGKIMVSLSDEIVKALVKGKKERLLETVRETIRIIPSDHFRKIELVMYEKSMQNGFSRESYYP